MRTLKSAIIIVCCYLWPWHQLYAATEVIAADYLETSPHRELIELALNLTAAEYGPVVLTFSGVMVQGRAEQELKEGKRLHLAVFAPSPERERDLLPVYFPLSQGLLGYRVCIIAYGQQSRFDLINSLQGWRNADLSIGQATHWPDVTILRHNNITVVTNPIYTLLFEMVRQQRFDCFARSLDELNRDLQSAHATDLVAEQQLLLHYPQLSMIFVSRSFPQLAERLDKGLALAWQRGLVQQHFQRHYGDFIEKTRCQQRRIIKLENPSLSEQSRQALQKYALPPEQLLAKPTQACPS
ncbi:hypothetical protein GCM10010919_01650 [Alishewanella longhuensis]|uniref:Solute-binding protein family 3/N-terminal domain-containing protein n=1 Tax=Alishewanella longhuensis TaxID=1091037 RepID=A0ABQ3KTP5_9ALTE|nr:hypothetical protein [Alishewanella longhuensis]GHG59268.1 hypothetical protein GCM10010919_01650 [Alishewanella longhuensis]